MKVYWITGCSDSSQWYAPFVGCLVEAVHCHAAGEHWGREPMWPHCGNFILPGDSEAHEVPDDTPLFKPWRPMTASEVVAPLLKALNDRISNE